MSEREKQTAFLRHCLVFDESPERHELEEGIAQILQDDSCLRRAMWLMALLMTLVLVCVGYAAVLLEDFLQNLPPFLIRLISALGLASLLSFMGFAGLRVIYRQKLNERHEKCRRLAAKFLDSRLAKLRPGRLPGVVKEAEALVNPGAAVASPSERETRLELAAKDPSGNPSTDSFHPQPKS